jgi:HlyD family secretion protein
MIPNLTPTQKIVHKKQLLCAKFSVYKNIKRVCMRMRWVVVCVAVGMLGWWVFSSTFSEKPEDSAALNQLMVTVVAPEARIVGDAVNVTGMTVAREEVLVMGEIPNVRVMQVFADAGDAVVQGQKLAALDDASVRLQRDQASSDFARAQDEFKRTLPLAKSRIVSERALVEKRTVMEAAKARLQEAELNVRRSLVVAPTSGVITERMATMGEMVSANEPLYRIALGNIMEVQANVPEAELEKLAVGQSVTLRVSGRTDALTGKVRIIAPRINSATRLAHVRIALPDSTHLPVGLFVNASIVAGEVQGMVIPATALQRDSQGTFVWSVGEDSKAVRLPVDVRFQKDEQVVIAEIPTTTRIIAKAGAFVKEGDVVRVAEAQKVAE